MKLWENRGNAKEYLFGRGLNEADVAYIEDQTNRAASIEAQGRARACQNTKYRGIPFAEQPTLEEKYKENERLTAKFLSETTESEKKEIEPRPQLLFPMDFAIAQADRRNAKAGITTVYHALSYAHGELGVRNRDTAADIAHYVKRCKLEMAVKTSRRSMPYLPWLSPILMPKNFLRPGDSILVLDDMRKASKLFTKS